jgi:excisionase family DNA binding protein
MTGARKYLRAAEIAALTGMSIRTIRRWIREKTLPSTKLGGARLVATADLEAVLSGPEDAIKDPFDDKE